MGIRVHSGWPAWFTSTASALFQLIFEAALGWYFREGNGVVWCHLNKTESWNMFFLDFLRDKKRFVLKTFSRLKSINLFYVGTRSEDEITELHGWTETSQIPQKHESGYFHGWRWNATLCCLMSSSLSPGTPFLCYPWVQAWLTELVPWLRQLPRKPAVRGSGDDLVVSSWTLGPDFCSIPAHDGLPGSLLVC